MGNVASGSHLVHHQKHNLPVGCATSIAKYEQWGIITIQHSWHNQQENVDLINAKMLLARSLHTTDDHGA